MDETPDTEDAPVEEAPKKRAAAKKPADPAVPLEFTMKQSEWELLRNRVGASGVKALDDMQAAIKDAVS